MESDFVALTDMINAKMLGMFDLIDKWIPQNNTIKKTLLQDIHFIGQEIKLFHTNESHMKEKQRPDGCSVQHKKSNKCRNGKNCWYFKRGRCWFFHEQSNTKDDVKQHDLHHFFQSEPKQFPIKPTINTNNNTNNNKNSNTNNSHSTPPITNTNIHKNKKIKNKHNPHAKSYEKSYPNKVHNTSPQKKKKKR